MKFKVGDKVKVICNNTKSFIAQKAMNEVGIIFSIRNSMIYVQFDKDVWHGLTVIGFFENEVERVVTKNKQLLFSFMSVEK